MLLNVDNEEDEDDEDEEDDQDDEGEDEDEDEDEGIMEEIDNDFNGETMEDSIGFFHDDLAPLMGDNDDQSTLFFLFFYSVIAWIFIPKKSPYPRISSP